MRQDWNRTKANWIKEQGLLLSVSIGALLFTGCSTSAKVPDVSGSIRQSLDQAGLEKVKVTQDRTAAVVTLSGQTDTDAGKRQAETLAKSIAANEVVANEIAVIPPGAEDQTKTVNADLDKGIGNNLDAALRQHQLKKGVTYSIKNGVVTLSGNVDSQSRRASVQNLTASVPNVQEVVNKLQIKDQRATSSEN
jgi:osmotically-inducible protein OsmY